MKNELNDLKKELKDKYCIDIDKIELSSNGVGSNTYIVSDKTNKYVVKYFVENNMNHFENEYDICKYLLDNDIPVCRFLKNNLGSVISIDKENKKYHVQHFIEGHIYNYNEAPNWLIEQSFELLGKIHKCLNKYKELPVGIGTDFFKNRTIERTINEYNITLKHAKELGDTEIIKDIYLILIF